ncbi:uncharacterized protein B0H18DRAFT_1002352 [Fomitopsis serialis]|uniref:uncharacterized protein n=1 Tax=Fomitopsis serialis TaxID=139415 RepID=UPI0020081F39|nr:uncharacterized protein B0H18DRAFT_1002352 [Neoantrodia serialis]KAH9927815.1 hypothetical protein B0H18DRAFT_1002352 [Neoantrodia serialis]
MVPKKSKRTKTSAATGRVTAKTEARWKNVRGRRGGLQDMLNMPIDVIQEICLYLHPRDLLSLSRTSKSFHTFLMQRSSAYLWKGSIKNIVDLPPRPEGWIEPAWISLIFSPYCTACGTGKATTVYWEFLARFCARCRPQMVVATNRVDKILNSDQWRNFHWIPKDIFLTAVEVTGFKGPCYSQSQVFEAIDTYGKLYAAGKWDSARKLGDEDIKRARRSREHAILCQKWAEKEEHLHTEEVEAVIRERLEDIASRLRPLGWGLELDFVRGRNYTPLSEHKHVRVAKKLTERVWQNAQDELVQCMKHIRKERLEHEYEAMLTARWSVLKSAGDEMLDRSFGRRPELMDYGIGFEDLALFKEFRDIMCAPADEVVDRARFLALEGQLDTLVEKWRTRICKHLRGLLSKYKIKSPRGVDPLDLATTLFEFTESSFPRIEPFPNVIAPNALRFPTPRTRRDAYEKFVYWQARADLSFIGTALKPLKPNAFVRRVIQLCGKDPDTATAREMDALDVRLVSDEIVTWRGAVVKAAKCEPHNVLNWRLADAHEIIEVKEIEMRILTKAKVWTCTRCEESRMPVARDIVMEHLCTE